MVKTLGTGVISLTTALCLATTLAFAGDTVTPLGTWMKANMGNARSSEDFPTLKKDFDLVGKKVPSAAYSQWATIAKAGSTAAAKQDMDGIKAACKQCHDLCTNRSTERNSRPARFRDPRARRGMLFALGPRRRSQIKHLRDVTPSYSDICVVP